MWFLENRSIILPWPSKAWNKPVQDELDHLQVTKGQWDGATRVRDQKRTSQSQSSKHDLIVFQVDNFKLRKGLETSRNPSNLYKHDLHEIDTLIFNRVPCCVQP
jgi:hypothetical protein